jgi:putative phosphoribosyl transferase
MRRWEVEIMLFCDRREAGRLLADSLGFLRDDAAVGNVVVLVVPRGGVVVGYEIAHALNATLDVYVTRKIGAPGNPELAIGAVASSGDIVLDQELILNLRIPRSYVDTEIARQRKEIARRVAAYRGCRPSPDLSDKIVILTDDGVATGSTILAAIRGYACLSGTRGRSPGLPTCPRTFLGCGSVLHSF